MTKKMKRIFSLLLITTCLTITTEFSILTVHADNVSQVTLDGGATKNKQKNEGNSKNDKNNSGGGADHNAEGGGNTSVGTTTGVENGASENKCGYRFYIIDEYGNSVSSHAVD